MQVPAHAGVSCSVQHHTAVLQWYTHLPLAASPNPCGLTIAFLMSSVPRVNQASQGRRDR